ncbi:MAG: hypothetical protein QOG77_1670 [Solirubrobacteraceae bacterium]|nr:hypothetical protein [Solirubrobacteraceae bacterium]
MAVVLLLALAAGGWIATRRRTEASSNDLVAQLRAADRALAAAHAEDKGWERANLEQAARTAYVSRYGDADVRELHLVQVVDNPGTDADQAVFRVVTDSGEHTLVLGRRDGAWVAA